MSTTLNRAMRRRRLRVTVGQLTAATARIAVVMVVGVLATASAEESTPQVVRIQDVAGTSPFQGCNANAPSAFYHHSGGREGEPMIAVNPANPRNRIAVWMDRTDGNVNTAYTTDAGRTWAQSIPPDVDQCTGNFDRPWEAAGDPWVAFGPDGVAYFSSLTWGNFENPPFANYVSVLHVQTSFDGGKTWSLPVGVGRQDFTSDKDSIAADPEQAGVVYATWRNDGFGLVGGAAGARQLLFSRSVDWGRSWTPPTVVDDESVTNLRLGNPQIAALPGGNVVVVSSLPTASGSQQLLAFRSGDQGLTWSSRIPILENGPTTVPPFVVCGSNLAPSGGEPGQIATVGDKGVAIITLDRSAYAAGNGWQIVLSKSSDRGRTWKSSTAIKSSLPIVFPSVAANHDLSEDGPVSEHQSGPRYGILWDEINPSTTNCSAGIESERTRFAWSDDGKKWSSPITLGAPWWNVFGIDVGDYHSLTATPSGYTTAAPQGAALGVDTDNPRITGDTGIIVTNIRTANED